MDSKQLVSSGPSRPFRTAAVLGAGVMGAQIAAHLANAGLSVELLDLTAPGEDRNGQVQALFARAAKLRPEPFFAPDAAQQIRLGNFDDHWARLAEVDWVIEAVIENLEIKRGVLQRLDGAVRDDAVITTNTSGLPIAQLIEGRSASFRRRFLGTHFFNPPRYMALLELVPTPDTDAAVLDRVREFGRVHLGKGTVVAKDTPNFIANRIGVHSILLTIHRMVAGGYTVEEVDALTGPLIGRPKSATLRTCDVVGLDTLAHVARNLYEAVSDDESREDFAVPAVLQQLIDAGALGAKSGSGFYKKEGRQILVFDPASGDHVAARPPQVGELAALRKAGGLPARLRALYAEGGRGGAFFREITLASLAYAARRLPEIADSPADVDRAMRWGFGHQLGPFETWDALGFDRVLADLHQGGIEVPAWVEALAAAGGSFYAADEAGRRQVWLPGGGRAADARPADEIDLTILARRPERVLWEGEQAALLDLGDGVPVFEFRSKANTLSTAVMTALRECIERVERGPYRGLVIGNGAEHFSPGANLVEMATAAQQGDFATIDAMIDRFQQTVQRVRYAAVPVVVAVRGRALGGACELLLACPHAVAAAESYVGLVELGAGLIPAGGGTMRMAEYAAQRARSPAPADVLPWLAAAFDTVARATVSSGAHHAMRLGFLRPGTCIVRRPERHLFAARQEVLRLSAQGYLPPAARRTIPVLGAPAREQLTAGLAQARQAGKLDEYGEYLGGRLASVITGGDLAEPAEISEREFLDLEREVFVDLLKQRGTQEKIAAIVGR